MEESQPGRAVAPAEDAYGQIYLALFERREAQEIMERDDGLIYAGDPSDYFAPYRRWPTVEKRAMRWVRGRVLDVGCGAGRVSLHLQSRGHDVLAIDESPLAVEVARRRGVTNARALPLDAVDATLGQFDTILILRNNLGLIGETEQAAGFLDHLTTLTTERGRIITDSVDPTRIGDPVFQADLLPADSGASATIPRYRVRWRQFATPWFRYLMFKPATFERFVDGTGWRVRRIIDDGSPRYAVVLEKARAWPHGAP